MEYLLMPAIGFIGFFLKGLTGTGTSTVIIALSSFVIGPKSAVVLASFVNIFGGLSMLRVDPLPIPLRYWGIIAVTMFGGSILGATTLNVIDSDIFKIILGTAFILVSIQFFFSGGRHEDNPPSIPDSARPKDLLTGLFAGFCGGFIGVNAPPLVLHFGSYLNKRYLRRLLVLIFIPAAIAQTGTFYWNGMLTTKIIIYGLTIFPAMFLGIYIGNKAHHIVSETLFKRILAVFLIIVSAKLILF